MKNPPTGVRYDVTMSKKSPRSGLKGKRIGLAVAIYAVLGALGSAVLLWLILCFILSAVTDEPLRFYGPFKPATILQLAKQSDVLKFVQAAIATLTVLTGGAGVVIFVRRQIELEAAGRRDETKLEHERERMEDAKRDAEDARTAERLRRELEQQTARNARFAEAAAQLGHEKHIIRVAGVYALEALAQEWAAVGNREQRGVCIDLLCGYLRSPVEWEHTLQPAPEPATGDDAQQTTTVVRQLAPEEAQVRTVIVDVISKHLRGSADTESSTAGDWSDHEFNFRNATIVDADFSKTHFDGGANFGGATLTATKFYEATLTNTNFYRATLTDTNFGGATLTDTNFGGATLTATDFGGATLANTFFGGATLTGTSFCGATLTATKFGGATLTNTFFSSAALTATFFVGAALTNTFFVGAALTNTNFVGAALTNTNFGGAALNAPTNFDKTTFDVKPDFSNSTLDHEPDLSTINIDTAE